MAGGSSVRINLVELNRVAPPPQDDGDCKAGENVWRWVFARRGWRASRTDAQGPPNGEASGRTFWSGQRQAPRSRHTDIRAWVTTGVEDVAETRVIAIRVHDVSVVSGASDGVSPRPANDRISTNREVRRLRSEGMRSKTASSRSSPCRPNVRLQPRPLMIERRPSGAARCYAVVINS